MIHPYRSFANQLTARGSSRKPPYQRGQRNLISNYILEEIRNILNKAWVLGEDRF